MARGGLIAGVAALVIVGGGVGGYVFVENKVSSSIDTLVANTAQHEAVESITYGSKQVDLLGDTISLSDVTVALDLEKIPNPSRLKA